MKRTTSLTNSQLTALIDDRIHSERDRRIMHLRLIDGWTYERIAEAVEMSAVQIKRIVQRCYTTIQN